MLGGSGDGKGEKKFMARLTKERSRVNRQGEG